MASKPDTRRKAVREHESFWKAVAAGVEKAGGIGPLDADGRVVKEPTGPNGPPAAAPTVRSVAPGEFPKLRGAIVEAEQLRNVSHDERLRMLAVVLRAVELAAYSDDLAPLTGMYKLAKTQGVEPVRFGRDEWDDFVEWLLSETKRLVAAGVKPRQLAREVRRAILIRAPAGAAHDRAIIQAWRTVERARIARLGPAEGRVTARGFVVAKDDAVLIELLTAAIRASCIGVDIVPDLFKRLKDKVPGLRVLQKGRIRKRV